MNSPTPSDSTDAVANRQEFLSAMFASMVIQQTNMASIFLGLTPNPQTGETVTDLDHARYFIDQLEMMEAKTKGNLSKQEEGLLKQSLTGLRMAFVEVVGKQGSPPVADKKAAASAANTAADSTAAPSTTTGPSDTAPAKADPSAIGPAATDGSPETTAAADSRKKFSKKY